MKKSCLFFVGIMAMILGSTMFVSCGSDDDDTSSKKEEVYSYTTKITIGEDVLKIYDNVNVSFLYPDGKIDVQPVTASSVTTVYESKVEGKVQIEFDGTLKADVVDDNTNYDVSINYVFYTNTGFENFSLKSTKTGLMLKEKYPKLSSIAGFKHTFGN